MNAARIACYIAWVLLTLAAAAGVMLAWKIMDSGMIESAWIMFFGRAAIPLVAVVLGLASAYLLWVLHDLERHEPPASLTIRIHVENPEH